MTHREEREALVEQFVTALERLAGHPDRGTEDRGGLARLKRCIGRELSQCRGVELGLFYRLLPRQLSHLEEPLFLVATLFPLAPGPWTGDLGRSLRALAGYEPAAESGLDRRVTILLDSTHDELPFRLRQLIARLAPAGVGIDWRELARDVIEWDAPWRGVQKKWARSYFGASASLEAPAAAS